MLLDEAQQLAERLALVIRAVRVIHQEEAHLPFLQDHLLHTQFLGHATEAHDPDQLLALLRYLAEAVFQALRKGEDVTFLLHIIQLPV